MLCSPTSPKARTTEMIHADRKEGFLKVANIAAHLLFLVSNISTLVSPWPDIRQTYFTPAIWAFYVWPVIHILLLCNLIYSFASDHGKAVMIDGISWEFPLLLILYAIFVTARASCNRIFALVVCIYLSNVCDSIYYTLLRNYPIKSLEEQFFIVLPFSACQAWNNVMFFLTTFEAIGVDATEHDDGNWTRLFVVSTLFILQCIAADFAISNDLGDRPGCFIISWALWAISDHQHSSGFIHGAAKFFFALTLLWSFLVADNAYRKCTRRKSSSPKPRKSYYGSFGELV